MSNSTNHQIAYNTYIKLLYLTLCSLPAIDMVNGYLMRESVSSVGILIKSFIMLYIVAVLINFDCRSIKWVAISCSAAAIYSLIHINYVTDISILSNEISWTFKFLYLYLCYRFFRFYIVNNYGTINLMFYIAFIVLIFNALFSFLGFGYSQYEYAGERVGSRGFFYAGNELGAFLIVVGLFTLYSAYRKNLIYYSIVSFFLLFAATQLASKVAIIGVLLSIPLIPLIFLFSNSTSVVEYKRTDLVKTIAVVTATLFSGIYAIYYVLYELNLYSRLYYFSKKFDILTLLFSYRNIWAKDMLNIFISKANVIDYLLGFSYKIYMFNNDKTVEIDCVDIFLVYGFVGILLTYGFLFSTLIRARLDPTDFTINKPLHFTLISIVIILLGVSITAGHVFNSGLGAPYFAAIIALASKKTTRFS